LTVPPSVLVALIAVVLVVAGAFTVFEWPDRAPWARCIVKVSVSSNVVARVYSRATIDPTRTGQPFKATSQEVFYESDFSLTASDRAENVSIEINHLQPDDRIALSPANVGTVSTASERWLSGFAEPRRSKPDFFSRTISIGFMQKAE